MLPTLPYSTAEIVNAMLPRNAAVKGTVVQKTAQGEYVIAMATGKITVKVANGELFVGDSVALSGRGKEILIEKTQAQLSGARVFSVDAVDVQSAPDSAALKLLADRAVEQLEKQVVDKDTLDQLRKILAAVAKNPQQFGAETVNAVAELKAIVSAMPLAGKDVSQTARDLADRIIMLGEKLAEKLRSGGGVVDVVLRPEAKTQEGYYRFDNVKSALSWLSENKELNENIAWQKLSQAFKDGPVVIKVYESAIGDVRASFVAPEKTQGELSHFMASSLRADVWKNVPESVLTKALYDLREIPLQRLLEIDRLLVESEKQAAKQASGAPSASSAASSESSAALLSKGYEAAFGQWLTIALDKDAPVQLLIPRVPVQSSQQIPTLLTTIGDAQTETGILFARSVRGDEFALQQETLQSFQRPETVLPDLFTRLGLNLESALSKNADAAALEINPQNLKTILLSLLNTIDAAAGAPPAGQVQNTASQPDTARAVQLVVTAVRSDLEGVLKRLFESVQSIRSASAPPLQQADNSAASSADGPEAVLQLLDKVKSLQNVPAKIESLVQSLAKSASESTEGLVRAYQEAARRFVDVIATQQNRVQAGVRADGFADAVAREVSAQLTDQEGAAAKALQNIQTVISDATGNLAADITAHVETPARKNFVPSTVVQLPEEIQLQPDAVLREIKQQIRSFVNELPATLASMVRQSTAGIQTAQKELAGLVLENPILSQPVLSAVSKNIETAIRLIDILGKQAADSVGNASALSQAKLALGEVLTEVVRTQAGIEIPVTHDAAPSAGLPGAGSGQKSSIAPAAAGNVAFQTFAANTLVAGLDTLTDALKDSQTKLVQQTLSDLDDVIGRLSEQIERQPPAVVRREALTHAFKEFAATINNKAAVLVREASGQVSQYATESARDLDSGVRQLSRSIGTGMHLDNARDTGDQIASRVAAQLTKTALDLQSAVKSLAQEPGQASARAAQVLGKLQQFVAQAAKMVDSPLSGSRQDTTTQTPAGPEAQAKQAPANPQQSEAVRQFENLADEARRQIMAKVKDLTGQLQNLGRQVSHLEDRLLKNAAAEGAQAPGQTKHADTLAGSLRDALRQLDLLARNVSDQASAVSHDVAKRLDDLSAQTAKLAERLSTDTSGQTQRSPLDTLKQQVENALTHVESLQVLARQVSVADGQQQVISLPMKIEGQWTDVVVKFVKKKSTGAKDASKKPVSVAIHVSPAMLGTIDVFMEYDGKKRFSMRMEFEKPSTRAWFENNKEDFSASLARIGFEAFKIDMKEIRPGRQQGHGNNISTKTPSGSSVIDITA